MPRRVDASTPVHDRRAAAAMLRVGNHVEVYRTSGGRREVTIKSINPTTGKVQVQWNEGPTVMKKTVDAAEIVASNT
jgi:hypothetical protein